MAVQTGPHDAQNGDDEQDGEGHVRTDEGGGEEGGEGAGEGAEDEGGEAERPDARTALIVSHVSLPWLA